MSTSQTARLIDPRDWKPRTPAVAELALSKGVPLRALNLSESEQDYLIAVSRRWPANERLEAIRRLAPRMKHKPNLSEGERTAAVFEAVAEAGGTIEQDARPLRGRPRKADPWQPRYWAWGLTVEVLLPRFFRRAVERIQASTDLPVGLEPEEALYRKRPSAWEHLPDLLRGASDEFHVALGLENRMGRPANPSLTSGERKLMRKQLAAGKALPPCEYCGAPIHGYHRCASRTGELTMKQYEALRDEIHALRGDNAQIREKLDRLLDHFPDDERVREAVDRFIAEALQQA